MNNLYWWYRERLLISCRKYFFLKSQLSKSPFYGFERTTTRTTKTTISKRAFHLNAFIRFVFLKCVKMCLYLHGTWILLSNEKVKKSVYGGRSEIAEIVSEFYSSYTENLGTLRKVKCTIIADDWLLRKNAALKKKSKQQKSNWTFCWITERWEVKKNGFVRDKFEINIKKVILLLKANQISTSSKYPFRLSIKYNFHFFVFFF